VGNYFLGRERAFEAATHLEAMGNLVCAIAETLEPGRREDLWARYFGHRAELDELLLDEAY
jgi:hypothetical protein